MTEDLKYREAVKRVKKKKGFYRHLAAYLAVNTALACVVLFSEGTLEGMIPAMFWGIGLAIHYFSVFGFPGSKGIGGSEWEQREIENEMRKMTDFDNKDFEPTDTLDISEELDLKQVEKVQNRYDESDLV